jgi:hypothetical protein
VESKVSKLVTDKAAGERGAQVIPIPYPHSYEFFPGVGGGERKKLWFLLLSLLLLLLLVRSVCDPCYSGGQRSGGSRFEASQDK